MTTHSGGGFDSLGWATLGASVVGSFGGSGISEADARENSRDSYRHALTYQPAITQANAQAGITGLIDGATDRGLHPLYALGGGGGGSAPAFQIPGQSPSGSHKDLGRALLDVSQMRDQKRRTDSALKNDEITRQLTQLRIDQIKNDVGRGPIINVEPKSPYVMPNINPMLQEIDKGKVQPGKKSDLAQNLSVKRAWTTTHIIPGPKNRALLLPAEEPSEVFESAALMLMTYNHPFNKPIIKKWLREEHPKMAAIWSPLDTMKILLRHRAFDPHAKKKKAKYLPRSSSAYKSKFPSHHYR